MKIALADLGWSIACWRFWKLVQQFKVGRWVPVRVKSEARPGSAATRSTSTRMLLRVSSRERRARAASFGVSSLLGRERISEWRPGLMGRREGQRSFKKERGAGAGVGGPAKGAVWGEGGGGVG